jgi:hypothetical protein
MRHALFLLGSIAIALAAAAACSSETEDAEVVTDGGTNDVITALPNVDANGTPSGPEAPAGTGGNTGLPCDVQAVLENRCIACHDGSRAVPMLTYGDLLKKSSVDPAKTIAELALIRMQSTTIPMPPPPAVGPEPDEIAIFDAWAKAGFPKETKACTDPPPDGGAADAGPLLSADAGDAGDAGPLCASGVLWNQANAPSPLMNPGLACNACHQISGGPNLRVAGTVYTALNERDLCYGKPNLVVRVTAADGKVFDLPVNNAGNFFLDKMNPKAPYKAMVVDGQKTRAMQGSVTSGDCNSCHTQAGRNGAPGRIAAP